MEKIIKVKCTFTEGILGTSPADPDVYGSYIGSNAPDASTLEDEIAALGVEEVQQKGRTVFPRLPDGTPFLYDYQIKGFFKDSCKMLARLGGTGKDKKAVNESCKIKAVNKVIDGLIFPEPRMIPIELSGPITDCQRPLRAQTMQGERVALSSSDEAPAGSSITFSVKCLDENHIPAVKEWLDYGALRGIGQWRNSGKGRFTWEEITDGDQKD